MGAQDGGGIGEAWLAELVVAMGLRCDMGKSSDESRDWTWRVGVRAYSDDLLAPRPRDIWPRPMLEAAIIQASIR